MSGLGPVGNKSPFFVTPELLKQLCAESKKEPLEAMKLMNRLFISKIPHTYIGQHPESIQACLKIARHLQKQKKIQEYEIDRIITVMRPVLQQANLPNQFQILDKEGAAVNVNSTLFKLACPQFFADKAKCLKQVKLFDCSIEAIQLFKNYLETRKIEVENLTSRQIIEACELGVQFSNKVFEQSFLFHLKAYAQTITTEADLEKFIKDLSIYTKCEEKTLDELRFAAFQHVLKAKGHSLFSLPVEKNWVFTDVSVFNYLLEDRPFFNSLIKTYVKGVIVKKLEDLEPLLCLCYLPKNKIDLKAISFKVPVDFQILNEIQETFPALHYLDVSPMVLCHEKSLVNHEATKLKELSANSSTQYLCFLNQKGEVNIEYATEASKQARGLFPRPVVFCSQEEIVGEITVSFDVELNKTDVQTAFKFIFNKYMIQYSDQNKLRFVKLVLKSK